MASDDGLEIYDQQTWLFGNDVEGVLVAEVVREQQVEAYVGHYAFGLQESDDADLPVPFPDDFDHNVFLGTHSGRIDITSGGHTHTATLGVEVWDGPPPKQNPSDWDEQARGRLRVFQRQGRRVVHGHGPKR